jgi:hypothetical protein
MISLAHASASTALMPDGWGRNPKFQILGRIVIADPVLVVDALVSEQRSTELLLIHDDVFEDVSLGPGSRMVWHPHHEVPGVVLGLPPFQLWFA